MTGRSARVIAFYLPQYHPIRENDEWWGAGFTEWTNVARARPLFRGHYQPQIPGELGFYDLRVPETRAAQAALAREHGVEAFCYWHYWFAGRRLLERPLDEVIRSGEPDFPFCLGWANQSWTGVWHGAPDRILIEQTYPGDDDHRRHFDAVLPALEDRRYFRVHGRPLVYIHEPASIPHVSRFIELWRRRAAENGLGDLYFVADAPIGWDALAAGFDAFVEFDWGGFIAGRPLRRKLAERIRPGPKRVPYDSLVRALSPPQPLPPGRVPCVVPNWDNSPRSGIRSVVVPDSTPERFELAMRDAVAAVSDRAEEERLVFVKSWNEWAEGNHLEPDRRFGRRWLEAVQRSVDLAPGGARVEHAGSAT